jgi:pilus assembly protein CpaB
VKNTRAIIMIFVAVLLGVAAVILASQWIAKQTATNSASVVVARVDIDPGTKLAPEMLKVVAWPGGNVPAGAVAEPKMLSDRVLKLGVQRDEPILESKLAPVGTKGGLSAVVAPGMRAITVHVNEIIGVAGFTLPGNYVDIMVNTTDDTGAHKPTHNQVISKIVLQHILVLAVAQEATRDETKPKVVNAVTLEVTPEQAEKLDLARSVGSLSLVLRNQVDSEPSEVAAIDKRELLYGDNELLAKPAPVKREPVRRRAIRHHPAPSKAKSEPAPAPEAPKDCVEVVRGMTRYNECF